MIDRLRSTGRGPLLAGLAAAAALVAAGCGSQGIAVQKSDPNYRGAELFAERCSGCHTLSAAGTEGSKPTREVNSKDRTDGPNLDQRKMSYEDTLTAIRGGGYSGAVMPGNIVVGEDAEAVAQFVAEYSGQKK
jgi:mono/diheme cytochrome c family protein